MDPFEQLRAERRAQGIRRGDVVVLPDGETYGTVVDGTVGPDGATVRVSLADTLLDDGAADIRTFDPADLEPSLGPPREDYPVSLAGPDRVERDCNGCAVYPTEIVAVLRVRDHVTRFCQACLDRLADAVGAFDYRPDGRTPDVPDAPYHDHPPYGPHSHPDAESFDHATLAEIADAVPETDEPPLCSCGRGYVGHANHDDERPPGSVGGPRTWSVYVRGVGVPSSQLGPPGHVGTVSGPTTTDDAEREAAAKYGVPRDRVSVRVHI